MYRFLRQHVTRIFEPRQLLYNSFTIIDSMVCIEHTHERKWFFFERKNPNSDCSRSDQMSETDEIAKIAPDVRTYI